MPDPATPRPPVLVVGAIIADASGRILIAQRPPGSRAAGRWEFPGGKLEPGEDPRSALLRECQEELGCTVDVGTVYEVVYFAYEGLTVLLIFYTARIVEGIARSMEQNALQWVTPEEMESVDLLEADRPLPAMFRARFPHFQKHH